MDRSMVAEEVVEMEGKEERWEEFSVEEEDFSEDVEDTRLRVKAPSNYSKFTLIGVICLILLQCFFSIKSVNRYFFDTRFRVYLVKFL